MLTGKNVADCKAKALLLKHMSRCGIVHAGKGYNSDVIRLIGVEFTQAIKKAR